MITVSVKINRPSNVVWDYFTTPGNWSKWYGGGLKEVVPSWQQGAKLVWALGGASPITNYIPGKEVRLSGAWMDTTYEFLQEGDSVTVVKVIESDPKGGAAFSDGGAAHKSQQEQALQKFKKFVERECEPASELPESVEALILAIRDEAVPMDFEFKSDARQEAAVNALVKIGVPAVEPLIAAIKGGKLENLASPVTYTYYVKALGGIGDPRAVQPLITLRDEVDFQMGLPSLFGDIGWPRHEYLRGAINTALAACQRNQKGKSEPTGPAQRTVLTFDNASKASEAANLIRQLGSDSNVALQVQGASVCFVAAQPSPVLLMLLKSRYGFNFSESDGNTPPVAAPTPKVTPPISVPTAAQAAPVVETLSGLEADIKRYTSKGYGLVSRTDTSATLSIQAPINVIILLALAIIFPIGAIIYVLVRKKYKVQLVQQSDGRVTEAGGTLEEYERDRAREAKRPKSGTILLLLGILIGVLGSLFGFILLLAHLSDPVLSKDPAATVITLLACPTPIVMAGLLMLAGGVFILWRASKQVEGPK